jgi:hypothetical protein
VDTFMLSPAWVYRVFPSGPVRKGPSVPDLAMLMATVRRELMTDAPGIAALGPVLGDGDAPAEQADTMPAATRRAAVSG